MELVNRILHHSKFRMYLNLNSEADSKRKFCPHDLQHAIDVARVAYIISLENGFNLSREIIYSAALLHDIAKWKQYRENLNHALEGAVLAEEILKDIGMNNQDAELIVEAIRSHRRSEDKSSPLGTVLYLADKFCRPCTQCCTIDECNRFEDGRPPLLEY